ncbi:DUF4767 domain-containing protein [Enterococcus devriesei]|uniref:DUF4767 domain-containing protein n=1 Tax=Enterococcus devriesei TaxID=319970 RepID=A0A1L8SX98_9ENTE|nr:DUF4767 domain-containing protein [Enterococcus devriesei]OJG36484.1 hypothetical protein RV00_GL001843 [Enterococcus devriesei]
MKKYFVLLLVLLAASGCGKQTTTDEKKDQSMVSDSSSAQSSSISSSSNVAQEDTKTLWTNEQANQLALLMERWGETMGQKYQRYNETDSLNFQNSEITKANLTQEGISLAGQNRDVAVFPPNEKIGKVNIVGIYSDESRLYLFTFDQGEPKVLVTDSGKNEQGKLAFTETQNQALKQGYQAVANGQPIPEVEKKEAGFSELSPNLRAILATEILDDRISFDPSLQGFFLRYYQEGNDLYVQLHSGAGVGHPIYHLVYETNQVRPIEAFVRVSANQSEKLEVRSPVSNQILFDRYQGNKAAYDSGETKVQIEPEMKNYFNEIKRIVEEQGGVG